MSTLDKIELERIRLKLESILKEGKVKQTSLIVCEQLDNFVLNDQNKYLIEDILGTYKLYNSSLKELDFMKEQFLKTLKKVEIKKNHGLEDIDEFLVELFMVDESKIAMNKLIGYQNSNIELNTNLYRKIHNLLLFGTKVVEKEENHGFRNTDTIYVGDIVDNQEVISYIPINSKEILSAVDYIVNLYNDNEIKEEEELFIKPIMIHGLISSLQCFHDGNTRLARMFQNIKLWNLTNLTYDKTVSPTIYISEAIAKNSSRKEYRDLVKDFAIEPNNENFNRWVEFNIILIEQQIYLNQDKLAKVYNTVVKKNK